jgi:hypothetical protein
LLAASSQGHLRISASSVRATSTTREEKVTYSSDAVAERWGTKAWRNGEHKILRTDASPLWAWVKRAGYASARGSATV